jgi:hypothetical protein
MALQAPTARFPPGVASDDQLDRVREEQPRKCMTFSPRPASTRTTLKHRQKRAAPIGLVTFVVD